MAEAHGAGAEPPPVVALVEHHRRKAGDRAALVHPDALERFRS
ncbi:hypothetical protein [Nocardioides salarius]